MWMAKVDNKDNLSNSELSWSTVAVVYCSFVFLFWVFKAILEIQAF